jgi:hypothetical protein
MQTAAQFINDSVEDLLKKNAKLERVVEVAAQLLEVYGDEFASYNEKQYALDKLGETIQEYELFLDR